ncbi:MAG TPA: AAA family ATPase [Gemmatimonadales bacterium]|nr:AAA family ATPase [Gemmatimonadales bacterium]
MPPRAIHTLVPHLLTVALKRERDAGTGFPFTVPAIASLAPLDLGAPVTLFVGENGSGKSTLLEGIAAAARLPSVGTDEVARDQTLAAQRRLGDVLRLTWSKPTHRGFFLRAEDFFGFQRQLAADRVAFEARLGEIDAEYRNRSAYAKGFATLPVRRALADMERRYGPDPDARSHGQAFLNLFQGRFVPGGLYLLDEPEAPLSPQNQLGLLALLLDMVTQDAQFVIASHSPILLAFPGAKIYSFDQIPVAPVAYADLDHVVLTRDFLNDPQAFLRRLETDA